MRGTHSNFTAWPLNCHNSDTILCHARFFPPSRGACDTMSHPVEYFLFDHSMGFAYEGSVIKFRPVNTGRPPRGAGDHRASGSRAARGFPHIGPPLPGKRNCPPPTGPRKGRGSMRLGAAKTAPRHGPDLPVAGLHEMPLDGSRMRGASPSVMFILTVRRGMRETLIPNSRAAPRGAANRSALVLSWLTRRWYRTRTRADGYRQDLISPWLKILDRR